MIPTYICGDSDTNINYDIEKLNIVGCRSRIMNDLYGETTSIGRGNIANITINLPQIALKIDSKLLLEAKMKKFKSI
jgi:ribonucleoside-triphosphate reductase